MQVLTFQKRNLFEIESRAVNVSNENTHAVGGEIRLARSQNEQTFAAIVVIELVAGIDLVAEHVGLVACVFNQFNGFAHDFSFGLAVVEKLLVSLCIIADGVEFFLIGQSVYVLSFVGEFHRKSILMS